MADQLKILTISVKMENSILEAIDYVSRVRKQKVTITLFLLFLTAEGQQT